MCVHVNFHFYLTCKLSKCKKLNVINKSVETYSSTLNMPKYSIAAQVHLDAMINIAWVTRTANPCRDEGQHE